VKQCRRVHEMRYSPRSSLQRDTAKLILRFSSAFRVRARLSDLWGVVTARQVSFEPESHTTDVRCTNSYLITPVLKTKLEYQ